MYVHVYASVCVYVQACYSVCLEAKDQYLPWSIFIYIFLKCYLYYFCLLYVHGHGGQKETSYSLELGYR